MCGYRFLISASYLYSLKTICICILYVVNSYPYPTRIRSIYLESKKSPPTFSANTGCPILIPLVVFGTDVDVAYFLMFATTTKKAKAIYLSQIAQKRK